LDCFEHHISHSGDESSFYYQSLSEFFETVGLGLLSGWKLKGQISEGQKYYWTSLETRGHSNT
jgi:hypothetical protein